MRAHLWLSVMCLVSVTACQTTPEAKTSRPEVASTTAPSTPKVSEAKPLTFSTNSPPDVLDPVKFAFPSFPNVSTEAKAGEYVLAPSYNWIKDAADKGPDSTTFIWYVQKMASPGQATSELQFINERHKVPNAYIISIPPGQKAKKGDLLLTWWQTGSGMQRAIVVDDADPARPVVRYLDLAYDNPAKSRDGSTTIGKMDEQIVADSFVKLESFGAGTTVAVQDGANQKYAKVIRVGGDSVLVLEGAGRLKVYPKASCTPIAIIPKISDGDRVRAPRYGQNFSSATVSRTDSRNGRVFVVFDGEKVEKAIAFSDVWKN